MSFDLQKDDVDIFLSDLKLLASILGYNDAQILEKFKEVFPGQIEAGLLNMDNLADAQAQAKQLVQIYKTDAPATSTTATVLTHTLQNVSLKDNEVTTTKTSSRFTTSTTSKGLTLGALL